MRQAMITGAKRALRHLGLDIHRVRGNLLCVRTHLRGTTDRAGGEKVAFNQGVITCLKSVAPLP